MDTPEVDDIPTTGAPEAPEGMEGAQQVMQYMPLPMLGLETSLLHLGDNIVVHLLYKDIGGEKPCWFPPELAIELGQDLVRLGTNGKQMMEAMQGPKLIVPGADDVALIEDINKRR